MAFPEKYTTGYAIDPGQCRELAEHREGLDQNPYMGEWTLAAAGSAWDFAAPAGPLLTRLATGQPATLGELAQQGRPVLHRGGPPGGRGLHY